MMQIHPLCAAVTEISAERYASLVKNLKRFGQRYALVTYQSMILDGRSRYRALQELGVPDDKIRFIEWKQKEGDSPEEFVLSMAVERRHMTAGERASTVEAVYAAAGVQPVGRPRNRYNVVPIPTIADRAEKAGVHVNTQKKAAAVRRADPALSDEVKDGKKTLEEAVREVKGEVATPKPKPESKPAKKVAVDAVTKERNELRAEVQRLTHELERSQDRAGDLAETVVALEAVKADKHVALLKDLQARLRGAEAERDTTNATREVMRKELKLRERIIARFEKHFGPLPNKDATPK